MSTIKKFKGGVPPSLRSGEWATNGNYAYLGMPFDEYKVFQGIFDLSESQSVSGFEFEPMQKGFIIKKDTPFSQIVDLINSLPKALKYNDDNATSIDLLFEDSTYMDDTGTRIAFRDFSYTINLKPLVENGDVSFNIDNAFLVNNSNVNFENIKFQYPASKGALELFNSSVTLSYCGFEAKQDDNAGDIVFKDLGLNRIVVVEPSFKMEADNVGSIFNVIESGTTANLVNPSLSYPAFAPKTAAGLLKGGIIIIGNANNIKAQSEETLQTSPTSNEHGGIEIRTSFADSITGSLTGLSYNDLADKPDLALKADLVGGKIPTIQLPSYVDDVLEYDTFSDFPATGESGKIYLDKNNNKSYRWSGTEYLFVGNALELGETATTAHRGDHGKAAYEHSQTEHAPSNATNGADWNVNVTNKPTTITSEQASAIESNTLKKSYPDTHKQKVENIPENINQLISNLDDKVIKALSFDDGTLKLTFENNSSIEVEIDNSSSGGGISDEILLAIEANTKKRTYPITEQQKVATLEQTMLTKKDKQQFEALSISDNKTTWDCTSGEKKTLSISSNSELIFSKLYNGFEGRLRLKIQATVTLSLSGVSNIAGSGELENLQTGIYWLGIQAIDSSNLEYNISRYE